MAARTSVKNIYRPWRRESDKPLGIADRYGVCVLGGQPESPRLLSRVWCVASTEFGNRDSPQPLHSEVQIDEGAERMVDAFNLERVVQVPLTDAGSLSSGASRWPSWA